MAKWRNQHSKLGVSAHGVYARHLARNHCGRRAEISERRVEEAGRNGGGKPGGNWLDVPLGMICARSKMSLAMAISVCRYGNSDYLCVR